jgi:hypothetical protein
MVSIFYRNKCLWYKSLNSKNKHARFKVIYHSAQCKIVSPGIMFFKTNWFPFTLKYLIITSYLFSHCNLFSFRLCRIFLWLKTFPSQAFIRNICQTVRHFVGHVVEKKLLKTIQITWQSESSMRFSLRGR